MGETTSPSPQLLSLVSAFLSEHGFETTNKALQKELKRKNLATDLDPTEDGVNLQSIVESWQKQEAQSSSSEDDSSSEGDDTTSESNSSSETDSETNDLSADSTSESSSESGSDSEEDTSKLKSSRLKKTKPNKREASPAASLSSSSDSDADDENEDAPKIKLVRKRSPIATKQTESINKLKRKAVSSSSEDSSSDSESSSDDDRPAKRAKVAAESETSSNEASSGSEESSDAQSSSSEEDKNEADKSNDESEAGKTKPTQPKSLAKLMNTATEAPSEASSNTVMGDVVELDENLAEVGESRPTNGKQKATRKTHVGARPTPLAQLSAQASADTHISNAYRSYEYAERAYNDLSVTRGKGFTKEKNKKKRGSYRGGAIDISGGKGFKFED